MGSTPFPAPSGKPHLSVNPRYALDWPASVAAVRVARALGWTGDEIDVIVSTRVLMGALGVAFFFLRQLPASERFESMSESIAKAKILSGETVRIIVMFAVPTLSGTLTLTLPVRATLKLATSVMALGNPTPPQLAGAFQSYWGASYVFTAKAAMIEFLGGRVMPPGKLPLTVFWPS